MGENSRRLRDSQIITRVLINDSDPRYLRYLMVCDEPDESLLPEGVIALREEARARGVDLSSLLLVSDYFCLS